MSPFPRIVSTLLLLATTALATAAPASARAADPCPQLRAQADARDVATRIAAIACQENHAWFRAFIDADGRAGGLAVYEAENDVLADGTPAWRKVAGYWNGSGLPGSCTAASSACRNFVVDTPWSAAFVSWVMRRAGVPGFAASARHFDYVRAAWREAGGSPYRMAAPHADAPDVGDLLCYVRANAHRLGHGGLVERLDAGAGLAMHCDIVVAAEAGGMAWLVGGNVQQAVTLRMLRLDAQGRFADLPLRDAADPPCSPDAPAQCNLNRQDWAALLKLRRSAPDSLLAARSP
ncbi:DUF2272 domain-containing protein [Luteimonas saliphila]|uniref:DUF2272 domain-containing protein n=1 Tax=Luteimonas saliphila TaxID=2804919 RepID=UPI00192D6B06|nr:DUF2272 domain-containing protein [Luteimonas saliphila]